MSSESLVNLDFIDDFVAFVGRHKTVFAVITVIVVIILLIAVFIYVYQKKQYMNIDENGAMILYQNESVDISNRPKIPAASFTVPSSPGRFSYAMWMHITDWYSNYGKWKHIFHRGTNVDSNCRTVLSFNNIPEQYPGIWLGDRVNNLRIALTTDVPLNACSITKSSADKNSVTSNTSSRSIEYLEMKNVPVGEWFHIVVVLRDRTVELYLNGQLTSTKILIGNPVPSIENGYLGIGSTVSGKLSTFRYIPTDLNATEVNLTFLREHSTYSTIYSNKI
jgi:hypothetical protein